MTKNNKGATCVELFVLIMVCIIILLPLYVIIFESGNQDAIKSKSEGYSCIYDGSLQYSKIALYYDESDNYVYCKIYAPSKQVLSYPLYTEDGNKIKYINGAFIEDNTGKKVRINDWM